MKATQSAALLSLAFLCTAAAQAVTIATVPVGNPGNPPDTRYIDSDHPNGVGSVAYSFHIGKTEVTYAQYTAFLNAVAATDTYELYREALGSENWGGIVRSGSSGEFRYSVKAPAIGQGPGGSDYTYGDKPVVLVYWRDAARFANWLHNGQPTGAQDASTTEDGAYTLNGATEFFQIAAVTRNAGARWWLPSEDEWYKAAYYDPLTGVYYDYPTGTNTRPNNNLPSADTGNSANFWESDPFEYTTGSGEFPMTDAGAYTLSGSPYGTFDQGGNVWEWNETRFPNSFRGIRGGSWYYDSISLLASGSGRGTPAFGAYYLGFRVASIPEPSTTCLGMLAVIGFSCWNRGRG
jgi:formylglycine-generating enzyme required for sulfatase activity